LALMAASDDSASHGPLELLFTVDEETGLTGASNMAPDIPEGKILLNLDSEEEGVFIVGCAGGRDTRLSLPVALSETAGKDREYFTLEIRGLKGGHSGVDIHLRRANAIKILARCLASFMETGPLRLVDITGGSAHNAIPRDCEAVVFLPSNDFDKAKAATSELVTIFNDEFKNTDPDLNVSINQNKGDYHKATTANDTSKAVQYILVMPHGVAMMSTDIKDLVETSNNFANIKIENNAIKVLTSQRSSVVSRLKAHTSKIEALARLAGGEAHSGDGYPPWQPNMESPLLAKSTKLYEEMFNKKPVVEVIHAGLECGIIGDKYPGMDMISIGPDLKYPHSPDEKIRISAIGKVWDFVVELLKSTK